MIRPALTRLSPIRRLSLLSLLLAVFMYPGQNWYQVLHLTPEAPKVNQVPLPTPYPIPVSDSTPVPPLTATSFMVFEPVSGTIIASRSSSMRLPMASTTKLMTALVSLDTYTLNQEISVITADNAVGNTMKLIRGDTLTFESILYGLLVSSGNDAALALAENYPHGGYGGFIDAMNQKAAALNLKDTHFSNVSGLDSTDHYTTVHDLSLITKHAMANEIIASIVATPAITVTNIAGNHSYVLHTTNSLLGKIPGVVGVKTGWTEKAGECLVTYTIRDDKHIIVVVLGSKDRFGESASLINWAYDHHSWTYL